ncbi:MAG: hypothetical protein ACOYO1_19725 [Bacteroidales bacterium]
METKLIPITSSATVTEALEEISFYPSCIMDKTIKNSTKELWNKSTFIVKSIDTALNIITIDRDIELPLFYETKSYDYANTWLIHGKGLDPYIENSFMQLKNVISKNSFEYEIKTTLNQTEATIEANFAAGRLISFVNPFTFYKPLINNYAIIAETSYASENDLVQYFPLNIYKDGNLFKAVILAENSASQWTSLHITESTDFINWTQLTAANKINFTTVLSSFKWWVNPYPTVYCNNLALYSSNVIDEFGNLIIPVSLSKTNATNGDNRIGILTASKDFLNLSLSDNYFTYSGIVDDTTKNWNVSSLHKYNDKIYLAVDVITTPVSTITDWSIYVFEVNIKTMVLTLIQNIVPSKAGDLKWNDTWITTPTFFEINNQLFLSYRGYGGLNTGYIIPNFPQPVGIMIFDTITNKFDDYFANPIQINPKITSLAHSFYEHGSQNVYITDNNINYALICMNYASSRYNILPVILNVQNKDNVNNWLSANNNIIDTATGLTKFTENRSVATPNATVPVHQLIASGAETNIDATITPKGTGALVLAIPDNTATGGNKRGANAVDLQTARSSNDLVASGIEAFAAGSNSKASGSYSAAIGNFVQALASYSAAIGRQSKADKIGQIAFGTGSSSSNGLAQSSIINMYKNTTDATISEVFTNGSSTRMVILSNNAWSFLITITAINTATRSQTASFIRKGLIYNNSGTTALEGAIQTIGTDIINASLAGIVPTITADDTNDSLKVQVTGKAATNINWCINVQLTEIGI